MILQPLSAWQMAAMSFQFLYRPHAAAVPGLLCWLFSLSAPVHGQDTTIHHILPTYNTSPDKTRIFIAAGTQATIYVGSTLLLSQAWYKGYARTGFHTFNDDKEWLQVDKAGHIWSAYTEGNANAAMFRWAGLSQRQSIMYGGLSGWVYQTVIEFLDGHSAEWGWSWGDMIANSIGTSLLIGQELLWREQRMHVKFSFHHYHYTEGQLQHRADDLFGTSFQERMLKDYNAQTYWLSANIRSFLPNSRVPAWLNVAVGYGADGMLGGRENIWYDPFGNKVARLDIPRVRQFYLAPDIDWSKIKTRKKWVRAVLGVMNFVKLPAPVLMINSKGKTCIYAFYF